ncbi:MAG: glycosyltransferase family 2 protein, partial [Candidatus Omnitrophica bacterium]|nr:glycosyltransferase family 2 protein [Candidatus Omnitrophota bacterium]
MFPKISIVIAGYNCSQTIEETLKACLNQDYPRDLYEVIFVDDGSNDGTQESVRKFPVRYIWQPHSGPAKARNIGWQEAEGEIIFFTDSDCVPDEEWIRTLIKNFNYEKVGAVGGSYGIKNSKSLLANCIYAEILWRHQKMSREV